jgi:peptidoglycan/xylan/chitin deacetylase (PgdA/CDA1 family)
MDNGVILLYHHVSDSTPFSTSVTPEQFAAHLALLDREFLVIPLSQMVTQLRAGRKLPDKAVSITFDDGYSNLFHHAHPLLKRYDFGYTVFINPALIGNRSDQLTWQQIQLMQQQGAEFANHANQHQHLLQRHADESQQDWLNRVIENIQQAESTLETKTSSRLKYLAYPYGEYNNELKNTMAMFP